MIVRPPPSGLGLLFALRGSVLPEIAPRLGLVLVISLLAVALHGRFPGLVGVANPAPFTLLGLGLPIFLSFRSNACYARWWEGRQQWGALLAASRNLLRDMVALLPEGVERRQAAHRVAVFARALQAQLRDEAGPPRCGRLLGELAGLFAGEMRGGRISDMSYRLLAAHLDRMGEIQASCERLRATPLPFAYSLMLHQLVWLSCLLLPFGLVETLGLATPLVTVILAYAFLGLDALGAELEAPFAATPNGLPLAAMVRAVEIAVAEALGESPPAAVAPVDFILL